jgi:hypothetical protein
MDDAPTAPHVTVLSDKSNASVSKDAAAAGVGSPKAGNSSYVDTTPTNTSDASYPSSAVAYSLEDFDIGSQLGRGKFGEFVFEMILSGGLWRPNGCWRVSQQLSGCLPSGVAQGPHRGALVAGHVFKVREKKTKTVLAMKVMMKREIKVWRWRVALLLNKMLAEWHVVSSRTMH